MAQNIIYSPWGKKTQGPWLCLMTTLLLFSLLWLFFFVSAFPTSLIKLILWVKFSTDKRQTEDIVGMRGRTIRSCSISLPINIQGWFPLGLTGLISLLSKGLSSLHQHHSSKASILQRSAFFMVQLSHPYTITGKTIALTIQTFVGNVISLMTHSFI